MSTVLNPYAAPKAAVEDVSAYPEADAIRREHISHEASIRSIGTLYYLGAFFMIAGTLAAFLLESRRTQLSAAPVVILAFFGLLAIGFFLLGRGLRALKPWARIPTTVLAVLGLAGFPLGTLLNSYILWLIHSKKGKLILSPDYAAIVEATPDVKYKTTLLVWILLGLIVVALLAVFIPLLSR